MGFLTTITIHNDALGAFEKNPKAFGEAILKGIKEANYKREEVSVGFENYANYISVQVSRHADDETIYVHSGNTVLNLNPYGKEFETLLTRDIGIIQNYTDRAEFIVNAAKLKIKQKKKELAKKS